MPDKLTHKQAVEEIKAKLADAHATGRYVNFGHDVSVILSRVVEEDCQVCSYFHSTGHAKQVGLVPPAESVDAEKVREAIVVLTDSRLWEDAHLPGKLRKRAISLLEQAVEGK